jgi:shikimate dehydrogenase
MMHVNALSRVGLTGHYLPLKVEAKSLKAALAKLSALEFKGLNVTAPHKQAVMPHLMAISPDAQAIGAVNTLLPAPGGFAGHNTDSPGFAAAYLSQPPGQTALVYGAGGAARAVIQALKANGLRVFVTARSLEPAQRLAQEFGQKAIGVNDLAAHGPYPILVNASSASYEADLNPAPQPPLSPGALVVDINYGRPFNHWERLATDAGARFEDGLAMLANQARLSFNLWTNTNVDLSPFTEALSVYLKEGLKPAV